MSPASITLLIFACAVVLFVADVLPMGLVSNTGTVAVLLPIVMGAAVVALVFTIAAESVPAAIIFAFFGVMMVLHLLWALSFVPETHGRKLEDIA